MPPNPPNDMQISKSEKKHSWPPPAKSWGRPWYLYGVLYCVLLWRTVLHCAVQCTCMVYCTVYFYGVLCCTVYLYGVLYCVLLWRTVLHCAVQCTCMVYCTVYFYGVLCCTLYLYMMFQAGIECLMPLASQYLLLVLCNVQA